MFSGAYSNVVLTVGVVIGLNVMQTGLHAGPVDLQLTPSSQTVCSVGATVDIAIRAISTDAQPDEMAAIVACLDWDPSYLALVGLVDDADSPYTWMASFFPDDGSIDGVNDDCADGVFCSEQVCTSDADCVASSGCDLNVPCSNDGDCRPETFCNHSLSCGPFACCNDSFCFPSGLPFNDGSALYEAWSSFTDPPGPALAQPGPNGLLVTKFRFQTLAATPPGGTQVTILPSCGPSTVTVVIDGGPSYKPVCCQGPGQGVILDPPATVHVGALAVAEGCRYIRVTPGEGTTLTALRVQGLSTDVTCVDHFVRIDGTLGTSPVFRTGTQWGTIFVRDERIIPSAQYRVATECGASTSSSVVVTTGVWGDVDNNLVLDVDDILLELDCFSGSSTADFEGCNLLSCEAVPGLETIDCDDLLATLDAFSGFGYEVSCPAVCP